MDDSWVKNQREHPFIGGYLVIRWIFRSVSPSLLDGIMTSFILKVIAENKPNPDPYMELLETYTQSVNDDFVVRILASVKSTLVGSKRAKLNIYPVMDVFFDP